MKDLEDDILGFEKFAIDEQLMSVIGHLSGVYARLSLKARNNHSCVLQQDVVLARFSEIEELKSSIKNLSYHDKLQVITQIEEELKAVLAKEQAAA